MDSKWFKIRKNLLNNIVWILLILAIVVVGGLEKSFFTTTVMGNVLSQATVLGILSFAQAFAIMLGLIDLSLLGVMSFSATTGLLLIEKGCPTPIAILMIFVVGALLGAMNGVLIAKLKAVALVETLAVKLTLLGAFLAITQGRAITSVPDSYKWFGQGNIAGIPTLPIALVIVFVVVYILWNKTPYGRSLYAVGGNEHAAYVSGIKIDRVKIIAFTISGLLAGIAGFFLSAYMGAVTSTFGTSYDMNNIAATVIGGVACSGGKGNVLGVLGGVLLLTVIQVGLQILGVASYYVQMINGLIIFIAVLLDAFRLKSEQVR
ncbi:ABC transporter permease [Faecalicatena contorta]|uniref:Xylose transport system permease protein XylH n=1 Tax=Faecalicatena contorta TaxID=39482 RepID=A0A315ZX10_9FIRM|nr:ABC transporter permease [Faecalicatena contorta]PWJ50085.1 monosaccharide ABC transporter membrane protein (CUT2 family) [Faecalicatena contorta]SUQ14206.1 monosaccharide ABC transporter membrane protein, CUT2 family [Faecalicatena contorta]